MSYHNGRKVTKTVDRDSSGSVCFRNPPTSFHSACANFYPLQWWSELHMCSEVIHLINWHFPDYVRQGVFSCVYVCFRVISLGSFVSSVWLIDFYFMCTGVLPARVCPQRPEESIISPGMSYRLPWAAVRGQGIEPRSCGRAECFSHWACPIPVFKRLLLVAELDAGPCSELFLFPDDRFLAP